MFTSLLIPKRVLRGDEVRMSNIFVALYVAIPLGGIDQAVCVTLLLKDCAKGSTAMHPKL
jgi:hypothetical protein